MFNHCLWYRIYNAELVKIIKNLSVIFKTEAFTPHLTIDHSLSFSNSVALFNTIKCDDIPQFILLDKPYQTQTDSFYAIQQDYINTTLSSSKVYHISLAYRVDNCFTKDEIDMLNNYPIPNTIQKEEMRIELWSCNSMSTWKWCQKM